MREGYSKKEGDLIFTDDDFLGKGGEGEVYGKGSRAYKFYWKQEKVIPQKKVQELSVLGSKTNIIIPEDDIYDRRDKSTRVGITSKWVKHAWPLPRLFANTFRKQYKVTPDMTVKTVEFMFETIQFAHENKKLLVDINDMAFLADEKDLTYIYFIDVGSYQTESFKCSAIAPGIRDYHAKEFNEGTDWYSAGIITFQLYVGRHPFKFFHPDHPGTDLLSMIEKMKKGISILNKEAKYPKAVRDFSVIPSNHFQWYLDMFENGKRIPPPGLAGLLNVVPVKVRVVNATENFVITFLQEYNRDIISHCFVDGIRVVREDNDDLTVNKVKYSDKRNIDVISNKDIDRVFVSVEDSTLKLESSKFGVVPLRLKMTDKIVIDDKVFLIARDRVIPVDVIKVGTKVVGAAGQARRVLANATKLYDKMLISDVLGKIHFIIPYKNDRNKAAVASSYVKELDEYRIVNARRERSVVMVVAYHKGESRYDRLIFTYDSMFNQYKVRIDEDVSDHSLNFAVTSKGIVAHMRDDDSLELFVAKNPFKSQIFDKDEDIHSKMVLTQEDDKILFYVDNKLYQLTSKGQ